MLCQTSMYNQGQNLPNHEDNILKIKFASTQNLDSRKLNIHIKNEVQVHTTIFSQISIGQDLQLLARETIGKC